MPSPGSSGARRSSAPSRARPRSSTWRRIRAPRASSCDALGSPLDARINRRIVAAARESAEIELLAVASRRRARAEEYARANGLERAYGSRRAARGRGRGGALHPAPELDARRVVGARARAGKHVLCEKPLARSAGEAERAFEAAERVGRLEEAFMYRHNPQTVRLKALVDDGAVGRVRLVRAVFSFPVQGEGNIRLLADLDGGALTDVGCYCVSGARLLCGEPVSVAAEAVTGPTGVDEVFAGVLRWAARSPWRRRACWKLSTARPRRACRSLRATRRMSVEAGEGERLREGGDALDSADGGGRERAHGVREPRGPL
ncbi:MAG: Gfo/Idh/MocA family protein, partial [Gaiellaceae bacterium]